VEDDAENKTSTNPSFTYSVRHAGVVPLSLAYTITTEQCLAPRPGVIRILVFDDLGFPDIIPCTLPTAIPTGVVMDPYLPNWLDILKTHVSRKADERNKLMST
jgi:hypothetical protein